MLDNLWQFRYHRGPAPMDGVCRASSEERAMAVARAWCVKQGFRPPASVRAFIVADESILGEAGLKRLEEVAIPDAVSSTTAVKTFK